MTKLTKMKRVFKIGGKIEQKYYIMLNSGILRKYNQSTCWHCNMSSTIFNEWTVHDLVADIKNKLKEELKN